VQVADTNGTGALGQAEFQRIMLRTNMFRMPDDRPVVFSI
jgi:hypothetical protein